MNPPPANSLRLRFSKLGLGCGTFGREIDQAAAFAMMDHAWAHQITHFDTAEAYGRPAGTSERIVGAWLASRRPPPGSLLLATKILRPYTPARIESVIIQSLKRLGLESVDLFYFHGWEEAAADPAVLSALDGLVRSGRVGALGASNFSLAQLERVLMIQSESGWARIKALQNNNNFAVRDVDAELSGFCGREDVAIVTYSPLGAGFLTGKHKRTVEPGSCFDIVPDHQDIYFNDLARGRLAELEAAAARTGYPAVHLAFAWASQQPGVDCVLVGGRTPAHLDQALQGRVIDVSKILPGQ
jgi:aryl-alcohol dehydrogenase-like predicted oxidoreductase